MADPLPRLRQVFVVEVDAEQIDVPRRLERSGGEDLGDLSRDGQCGVLRVTVDIPVACGCIVVVEANSVSLSWPVHSISSSAVRPMDATAGRNRVPFPTGPAVIFSGRTMRRLNRGSLLWSGT